MTLSEHPAAKDVYSSAGGIIRSLERNGYSTWGFIVYRCTYGDDDAWDHFKKTLTGLLRGRVLESDARELIQNLAVTFLEDKDMFDGASTVSLRQHFNDWVRDNWQREQPGGRDSRSFRYECFFRVDRAALESVLGYPRSRDSRRMWTEAGHVDFVDASWRSVLDFVDPEKAEEEDQPDLSFAPIEGCREEDVGWMKVPADRIGTGTHDKFDGSHHLWYTLYERPTEIAFWT